MTHRLPLTYFKTVIKLSKPVIKYHCTLQNQLYPMFSYLHTLYYNEKNITHGTVMFINQFVAATLKKVNDSAKFTKHPIGR